MKKHLISSICILFLSGMATSGLLSQTKKEAGLEFFGLNFNGNNSFAAFYKKQKSENVYSRWRGTFGGFGVAVNEAATFSNGSIGLSFGTEKRREVGKKATIYTGPEFSLFANFSKSGNLDASWLFAPRIGCILGIRHDINEYWAVGMEIVPGGGFSVSKNPGQDVAFSVSGSFTSNAAVGLTYKF